MAVKLKRKVAMELLTTYLPPILLLLITFTTIFFDLLGDVIAVNLTIMLVITTIFTSKKKALSCWWKWWSSPEELPPTSDMKMIDIWLIFCLVVPFLEVVLRTAIECMHCMQLSQLFTWVNDDLANIDLSLKRCNSGSRWATEVPKKGKSSKFNFQDDGHINSDPAVHV